MTGRRRGQFVQTVQGPIDPEDLGVTLMHEHLLMKLSEFFWGEPEAASEVFLARQPIGLRNLSWLKEHAGQHIGDFELSDELEVAEEAYEFYVNGGDSIVDATPNGLKRDPLGLARISRRTGLNVIAGCGYYVKEAHPSGMQNRTMDEVEAGIVRDIEQGIGDTDVCAGIIGEIGMSLPWSGQEEKVLRAAARAQLRTGAAILVHPARSRDSPMKIIRVLDEEGADLRRVVMCHIERTVDTLDGLKAIADRGCYLEFDLFGNDGYYQHPVSDFIVPNDQGRIGWMKKLMDAGYTEKLLMSHDVASALNLTVNGGYGYAHILKNVVPWMKQRRITRDQIRTILVDSPKRLLTLEAV